MRPPWPSGAIGKAKPTTIEGAIALIKFIAESKERDGRWIIDMDSEIDIGAVLHRAHDVIQRFRMARSSNAAAVQGRKAA